VSVKETDERKVSMTTKAVDDVLGQAEGLLGKLDKREGGAAHAQLRRLFAAIGQKLREFGDVIVFVNGRVAAMDRATPPSKIVELAGKDPTKNCVFRLNPCGGPPTPLKEGDALEEADQLVVSLCVPPADGAGRETALAHDVALLARGARSVKVARLREGQDALLAEFQVEPDAVAVCGVVVSPLYPATGPDWFILDARYEIQGFSGGKRGPFHDGELQVMEYSIPPPRGTVPTAAEHVISIVARRLTQFRRKAA
jgi:hypothetical protein